MKKYFIALAAVAFFSLQSNAQMWLTTKAGGGLALASGYNGSLGGLSAIGGVGYKHQISKRMMVEGDILMDTRALFYPTNTFDVDNNLIYFTGGGTYIQIPLTLQYIIPFKKKELIPYRVGQPKSYWFIEGGPYVSYGLSVNTFADPTVISTWIALEDSIPASNLTPRKFDVGVTVGLGVNFSIRDGKNRLIFGTRSNYGFINMYKDARLGSATNLSAVGYIALDYSLTKRKHIKHRW